LQTSITKWSSAIATARRRPSVHLGGALGEGQRLQVVVGVEVGQLHVE
jgi:hypothetical protein